MVYPLPFNSGESLDRIWTQSIWFEVVVMFLRQLLILVCAGPFDYPGSRTDWCVTISSMVTVCQMVLTADAVWDSAPGGHRGKGGHGQSAGMSASRNGFTNHGASRQPSVSGELLLCVLGPVHLLASLCRVSVDVVHLISVELCHHSLAA